MKPASLVIKLDWEDRRVILTGVKDRWGLHAVEGSESTFRWSTLDSVLSWLSTEHEDFAIESFPDDISAVEEEGEVCALLLGKLRDSYFFGYQGVESFWGGTTSLEELERIFQAAKDLRNSLAMELGS